MSKFVSSATPVLLNAGGVELAGDVRLPDRPRGLIVFAHGSGSSRHSSRNVFVAESLGHQGFGTLLMDLLTRDEEFVDQRTAHLRFDVGMLGGRVAHVIDWLDMNDLRSLPIGLFGASTGAAAALIAAAVRPGRVHAIVSRGGRPDLAAADLPRVKAPTLLLVGELDDVVIGLNRRAAARMSHAEVVIEIVPGATHLFEEPGALDQVARHAANWFDRHLPVPAAKPGTH